MSEPEWHETPHVEAPPAQALLLLSKMREAAVSREREGGAMTCRHEHWEVRIRETKCGHDYVIVCSRCYVEKA